MSLVFLALNIKLLLFFFLLCVKVVNTCKIHALLLTKLQGQFIELHKTQLFKRLGNLTWDCIVPFFLIKILENWWLPSLLKAFIWKKNVGSRNIQIYIYSRVPNKRPPTTAYFFSKNLPTCPPALINIIQCIVFDFAIIIVVFIFISKYLYRNFKTLLLLFISVWW